MKRLRGLLMFLWLPATANGEPDGFLDAHWGPTPKASGEAMSSWGALEGSLLPQNCGACHPMKLHDWRGSRHSMAMSPGLRMQLIDNPTANESCNACHAPLEEQRPMVGDSDGFRSDLQETGLSCVACHVRDGEVHGPPRREGAMALPEALPHAGFQTHDAFEDSRFCASCHQFAEEGFRVEGVLLENTFNEWAESPQGQRGESCQSCHMPDRRHLWRGIHDPAMTEQGLGIELATVGRRRVRYTVTNSGVGHFFPTYVTPRISLIAEGLDANGRVLIRQLTIIQRRVNVYMAQEYDTRIAPGDSASVDLVWSRRQPVVLVRAQVLVEPDEFYFRFFQAYRAASTESHQQRAAAIEEARNSPYVIGIRTLEP